MRPCKRVHVGQDLSNDRIGWMEAKTAKCQFEDCGKDFTVRHKDQRFCCAGCRFQYHNAKKKELAEIGAAARKAARDFYA